MGTVNEKPERNKEVVLLHLQGLSYNQIAKQLNLTSQNVYRIIKAHSKKYATADMETNQPATE